MNGLLLDLRVALRVLLRSPGPTLITFLMLAIGIGATTSIYAIVRSVLLEPLPFSESEQLLHLCETNPRVEYCVTAPPNAQDWALRSRTLAAVGLGRTWHYTWKRGETARGLTAGLITPSWFEVLRVQPQLGRLLQSSDQTGVGAAVVVLSDELWRSEFGADRGVIGSSIDLEGEPHTIVGVAPPNLVVPGIEVPPALWRPLHIDPRAEEHREWRGFTALARMRPGVTIDAVRADLSAVAAQLAEEHPGTNREWSVRARSLHDYLVGGVRPTLWLFAGAVVLVLLIVCANTANLLLARALERQSDLAIRIVNGASRPRLARQLLLESGMLALSGAVAGYVLARWGTNALLALAPAQLPRADEIRIGAGVLGFAIVLGSVVTLLVGLAPALWTSQTDVHQLLRAANGRSARRFGASRGALIVGEVALSMVLLVVAGLLLRTIDTLLRWDPGFPRDRLLMVQIFAPSDQYPEPSDVARLYERATETVAALPGVERVGSASAGPLFGGFESYGYRLTGDRAETTGEVRWYDVDHEFLPTLGLPIVRGRNFDPRDDASAPPVAIINESFAARHWPNANPVGQHITLIEPELTVQIVGVVRDVPPFGRAPSGPEIYWPQRQQPRWATYLVVRTEVDPNSLVIPIQNTLAGIEPDLSIGTPLTVAEQMRAYTARERFNLVIIALFSAVAVLLAVAGLFGVIRFTTAQRTREFAIRSALGGRP
ncbi:MAG TPA: ABC transporter permease, partial [Longimicrobiales bacterium]|nr:ABC transporter permease [Longimicrobiales bacterium]